MFIFYLLQTCDITSLFGADMLTEQQGPALYTAVTVVWKRKEM